MRAKLIISVVTALLLCSSAVFGVTISVPTPEWPTIQAGIDAAFDGDTVLVQPGTYVENINFNGKNITVGSLCLTTGESTYISQTVIDGNQSGSVVTFESGENSTAVLIGFTIINGIGTLVDLSGKGIYLYCGGGIICINSSPSLVNLAITGNSVGYEGGGIYCFNNSNPTLVDVMISGNSAFHGGGIGCRDNSSPYIENVTVRGNTANEKGGGVWVLFGSNPHLANVMITGNTASQGGGIHCQNYVIPNLVNVTIAGNTASQGGGIHCWYNSRPVLVNTILWNNLPEEIYFREDGDPNSITVSYSDVQRGESGIVTNDNGTVYWLGGNIDADPLFVGANDYHLTAPSPCIDAGTPEGASDTDIDGNSRPQGAGIDMGADEYTVPESWLSTMARILSNIGKKVMLLLDLKPFSYDVLEEEEGNF
jgi:hypothetical protein